MPDCTTCHGTGCNWYEESDTLDCLWCFGEGRELALEEAINQHTHYPSLAWVTGDCFMTNQEHFDRSVAVLVKAFNRGDLNEVDCAACACGNLVAAANGYEMAGGGNWLNCAGETVTPAWHDATYRHAYRTSATPCTCAQALSEVKSTGYTTEQLHKIEQAFMLIDPVPRDGNMEQDEDSFNGLMAAVEALSEIHDIDLTTTEAAKALFVKA
ncbi:MAG: hypothetical protein ACRYFX_18545 [Janthinobacterium lividum]